MSDISENAKYKWTPDSTSLLVSVWSDKLVQKQFEYASKPQLIWESVSRYMRKKGYEVTARQCKSRMKQVLVCYKESKKSGTNAGIERYYESIERVIESKKLGKNILKDDGIDTVDSVKVLQSPPKDMKTNVNLKVQNKFGNPARSLMKHIEGPTSNWQSDHEEYGDSSESNETVVVRFPRSLSPMKNVATNTISDSMPLNGRATRRSLPVIGERMKYENLELNDRFSEIPLKNSVQNVQNQIIQENMMLRNQLAHENIMMHQPDCQVNINPNLHANYIPDTMSYHPNRITTNMARIQSQLQQYSINPNPAMPQEPRKFRNPHENIEFNPSYRPLIRNYSDQYAADIAPNLNDAFCQTVKNTKVHNLNETYDQPLFIEHEIQNNNDATTITNNATFNDDTISIEFIQDSPSPTENEANGLKNNSFDNSLSAPNAPARLKKIQKLEQLMLNAMTSQTEVVNKILAAQDVIVSKILDFDKERQHRLEDRLDQLMNVVQQTVTNKKVDDNNQNTDTDGVAPLVSPIKYPVCFSPPPKPGTVPPKLDLVPPKPCRVPCTNPSVTVDLINQNPIQTRPGIIAPPKPGRIWEKLGPVSQSPFVKAQQQISAVTKAAEHWRTISSAERRIARSLDSSPDTKIIIEETKKFLQSEKLMEERIGNAKNMLIADKDTSARRKLFEVPIEEQKEQKDGEKKEKEPSAVVVLTKTFLEIERQAEEKSRTIMQQYENDTNDSDDLLTGQGASYERLRRLSFKAKPVNPMKMVYNEKLDTSTPAKCSNNYNNYQEQINDNYNEPRQTIQQLAELVMNSARWRNAATAPNNPLKPLVNFVESNKIEPVRPPREIEAQRQSVNKARDWLQDQYIYEVSKQLPNEAFTANNYPIGFSSANLNIQDQNVVKRTFDRQVGFSQDAMIPKYGNVNNREMLENERKNIEHIRQTEQENNRINKADDDDDEEFLDTTTTLQPYRKPSLTSTGMGSGKSGCIIS
ncbi:uncharacterized protein [Chelonus insularis]|uniref:uncharacterized protein n=1 Tax=Chelonus insularis TaxID=460826 RepID=UPI00158AA5C2|nr:uncharacterized protein LOC118072576 [Chelonus insularis]